MAQQSTAGGSTATDFQPTTGNPQSNVSGGFQPNSGSVQPVTTSSGSNVFNQPGINPQAFPKTSSLQVLNTGTEAPAPAEAKNHGNFTLFFLIDLAVLVAIVAIYRFVKRKKTTTTELPVVPTEVPLAETVSPKSKQKKKSKKKRQGKKKNRK